MTLTIYTNRSGSSFESHLEKLAQGAQVVRDADIDNDPTLLDKIDIWYGSISPDQLGRVSQLKWIQHQGAGVNGMPLKTFAAKKIVLTNASGVHAEPITEHMFGMLLMVTRCLDKALKDSEDGAWNKRQSDAKVGELFGKTLGLLGVGAIGEQSALVGRAFGMRTIGLRRSGRESQNLDEVFRFDQRERFFAESDVIMNTLPATPETVGFVGASEIAMMKPGVILINTGRGNTIDTDALIAGLQSGQVGHALLDVTDPEPLPDGHPLWTAPNVFVTPHYSGSHPSYNIRADEIFFDNLERFCSGVTLRNVVDLKVGY